MPKKRHPGINYFTFSGNPNDYRVEDAVREVTVDSWRIPRCDVRKGDRAIIWKAKGRETKSNKPRRGIIAFAEILEDPKLMEDLNPHYWVKQNAVNEARIQVIRYLVSPRLPLWEGETNLKLLEEKQLSVQSASQGSIFLVTCDQWKEIMQAVGGWPTPEVEDAEFAIAEVAGKKRLGQGFRIGVAERQAIEQHAMQVARTYYEEQGWSVTDVSDTCSYDLLCERDNGEELHVEVKGTTSDGQQILLTRNEVEHARYCYPNVALFVLANIKIERTSTGEIRIQADSGEPRLLDPWNVAEGAFTPLAFKYRLPTK